MEGENGFSNLLIIHSLSTLHCEKLMLLKMNILEACRHGGHVSGWYAWHNGH